MSCPLRVAVLTAVTLHALTATLQAADCPNVVLIISDDQTYSDFGFMGHPSRDVAYRWIRDGKFKLIIPHANSGQKPWGRYVDKTALFDVVADPHEQHNLADDKKHAEPPIGSSFSLRPGPVIIARSGLVDVPHREPPIFIAAELGDFSEGVLMFVGFDPQAGEAG